MKYYRIFNIVNEKITGNGYPQIINPIFPTTYESSNALHKLHYADKINSNTEIPKGVLNKRAKQTDLLTSGFLSGKGFISKKLKTIFEKYKIKGVQIINTSIFIKDTEDNNYYILHPHLSDFTFINFAKSEFAYTNTMGSSIISQVSFNSISDYLLAVEKNIKEVMEIGYPNFQPLKITKLVFKEDSEIDFFSVDRVYAGYGFYVSEKLKNAIEEAGCTGLVFTDVNEIYP